MQDDKNIVFSGLSKPDHQIKSITFKILADKKKPTDILKDTCDIVIGKIKTVKKQL